MDGTDDPRSGPSTSYFEGLLDRIRAGDEAAKGELVRDAYPRARRLTQFILRGEYGDALRGLTDEVCSISYEKFDAALRNGLRRDFSCLGEMFGYLGRIIRRSAIDVIRALMGPKSTTQFPRGGLPAELAGEGVRTRLSFYEMIEGLPEDEARLIELRFLYNFGDAEIAEVLRVSPATVGRKGRKALLRLKREFDAPGGDAVAGPG